MLQTLVRTVFYTVFVKHFNPKVMHEKATQTQFRFSFEHMRRKNVTQRARDNKCLRLENALT